MSSHYFPTPRGALNLAFLPQEYLEGDLGRKRIEVGMRGIERHQIEDIDGYGYVPSYGTYVDYSLLMIACYLGNTMMTKYWIEEFGVNPNVRSSTGRSALLTALQNGQEETTSYLLNCDKVEIGLPEAAALQKRDILSSLIKEYDDLSPEDKIFGLKGAEVAYIYSGLSGDLSWVQELMKNIEDPNIGAEVETGSVLSAAVMSGNIPLVEELLSEGIRYESLYNHDHILFNALPHVHMLEYLVNKIEQIELQIVSLLDVKGRWRNNLLERCLVMRYEDSFAYLLAKEPLEQWVSISRNILLLQSLQTYNRPAINNQLIDSCPSIWWVIKSAEQASNNGDIDLLCTLIEEKGCELAKTYDDNSSATMLEKAAYSGSVPLVKYIIENEPYIAHFKHENGYNHLVAAVQCDSVELMTLLVEKYPELLNKKVWNGQSLIMIACNHLAVNVAKIFLSPEFYSKHYKEGEIFDINHKSDDEKTSLWYAAQSGSVDIVEQILTGNVDETFDLEEVKDVEKVNDLFIAATKSTKADKLYQCFEKFNLNPSDKLSTSLSLTATTSKSIYSIEDQTFFRRLITMDNDFDVATDDETLLSALIENAPEWAIRRGIPIKIVKSHFDSSTALQSKDVFEKALRQSDHRMIEYLLPHQSIELLGTNAAQFILDLLVDNDILKTKKIPHFTLTMRREKCIRWLSTRTTTSTTNTTSFSNNDISFQVYRAVLCADMNIGCLTDELIASGIILPIENLSDFQLSDLLRIALNLCQTSNTKIILQILGSRTQNVSHILESSDSDKESNLLVLVLQKSHKEVPDIRNLERPLLISWLLETDAADPAALGNKKMHPTMFAAKIGDHKSFKIIRDATHVSILVEDEEGNNLVYYVIEGGEISIIKNYCNKHSLEKICGRSGEYPIHVCAGTGDMAILRYLIEMLEVNAWTTDHEQRTIFHYSALRGKDECVEYMKTLLGGQQKYEQGSATKLNDASQISRLIVGDWLEEISKEIKKDVQLNTNGICAFVYEEFTIVIEVKNESAFIYTTFDATRFAIKEDSWKLLLTEIEANLNPCIYYSVDNALITGSEALESDNLMSGVNIRVNEMDNVRFRALLEDYIEFVLKTGMKLDLCASKRYLREILLNTQSAVRESNKTAIASKEISSKSMSNGRRNKFQAWKDHKMIESILGHIGSFLLPKPKEAKPPMSDTDLLSFRKLLDNQFTKLKIAINKSMLSNEKGLLAFTYDSLTILIEPVSPKLFGISAIVFNGIMIPQLRKNALLMNYLGQFTRGGVIKETPSTITAGLSEVIFFHHDRIDLDVREFRNILENFIDTALNIKEHLPTYHEHLFKDELSRKIQSDLLNKGKVILHELSNQDKTFLDKIFAVKDRERMLSHLDSLGNLVAHTGKADLWFDVATSILVRMDDSANKDFDFFKDTQLQIFSSCIKYQYLSAEFIALCFHNLYHNEEFLKGFIQKVFHSKDLLERVEMHSTLHRINDVVKQLCEDNNKVVPKVDTQNFDEYCDYILLYARGTTHPPKLSKEAIDCLEWIFERKPIEANKTSALLLQAATTYNTREIWFYLLMKMKPILSEDHFKFVLNQNFTDRSAYGKMNGESIAIIEGIIKRMNVQKDHDSKLQTEGPEFYVHLTFKTLQWHSNNIWEATAGDGEALSIAEAALKMLIGAEVELFASKYRIPTKRILSACKEEGALKALCEECSGPGGSNLLHIAASKDSQAALSLCKFLVEVIGMDFDKTLDGNARSARTIAIANSSKEMQTWARSVGCFLGRYSVEKMVHKSATCVVYFATDEWELPNEDNTEVAIKILTNEKHFQSELMSRLRNPAEIKNGTDISPDVDSRFDVNYVLPLIRFHDEIHQGKRWRCLVMPRAERNLDEVIRNEHICGNNINHIQFFAKEIATSLQHLHEKTSIHADFKPRNIVRLHGKYLLIDFDSCTPLGEEYSSEKISTAYISPELAGIKFRPKKSLNALKSNRDSLKRRRRMLLLNDSDYDEDEIDRIGKQIKSLSTQILQLESEQQGGNVKKVHASPAYDVWSFGCVMYTMLTKGLDLFKKDQGDNIVETEDKLRLANWNGLTATELNRILPLCEDVNEVNAAKDLLNMCLNGDSSVRFKSMKQVLNHRFLKKVDETQVYKTLQAIRKEQSFRHVQLMSEIDDTKESLTKIMNRITESSLKIARLIGSRDQVSCPNLACLEKVPKKKKGLPRFHNVYNLFFICAHSGERIDSPIQLTVRKEWVKKIVPFLKAVVIALKIAGLTTGIPLPDFASNDEITASINGEMLPAAFDKLNEMEGETTANFTDKEKKAIKLVGDGYLLVEEKAKEDSSWTEYMQRVIHNEKAIWVKNDYANIYL